MLKNFFLISNILTIFGLSCAAFASEYNINQGNPDLPSVTRSVETWNSASPRKICGNNQLTIADSIQNCRNVHGDSVPDWDAKTGHSISFEILNRYDDASTWKLVAISNANGSPNGTVCDLGCREIWLHEQTKILWSDVVGDLPSNENTGVWNWFKASGVEHPRLNPSPKVSVCEEFSSLASAKVKWVLPGKLNWSNAAFNRLAQVLPNIDKRKEFWTSSREDSFYYMYYFAHRWDGQWQSSSSEYKNKVRCISKLEKY